MDWKPEVETRVRSIFNGWANSVPDNPFPDFGSKITLVSIAEKASYVVSLNNLFEIRFKPMERTKPYQESMAAALANGKFIPPDTVDIWTYESPLKSEFVAQEADVDVPDSYRAIACLICEGKGSIACSNCAGNKMVRCTECSGGRKRCEKCSARGKIACITCRGKGSVASIGEDKQPGPDIVCADCSGSGGHICESCEGLGGTACQKCQGQGTVLCLRCKGTGTQPCQQCAATGKTVKGLSFKIQYLDGADRSFIHDPNIPEGLLPAGFSWSKVSEQVVSVQDVLVPPPDLSAHPPYLKSSVESMLKKAEAASKVQAAPARIIQQKLLVEKVPVFSVVYKFQEKMYETWITAVDNKAVGKENPFKAYAREATMRALSLASGGDQGQAQEILSKASSMSAGDADLEQAREASLKALARHFLVLHQFSSLAVGMGLMAFLAYAQAPTHHLFWPVFTYGASVSLVSLTLGYILTLIKFDWMSSWIKRLFFSAIIAVGLAAAAQFLFYRVQTPHQLDVQEYKDLMSAHFQGPPSNASPSDLDFLKFMVQTYEPLGVDVSEAKNAIDETAKLADELRHEAETHEKALAEAKGKRTMKAQLVRQEIEAARLRRQQADAAARKTKKKKKKKPAKKYP